MFLKPVTGISYGVIREKKTRAEPQDSPAFRVLVGREKPATETEKEHPLK